MWSQGNARVRTGEVDIQHGESLEIERALHFISAPVADRDPDRPLREFLASILDGLVRLLGAEIASVLLLGADSRMRIAASYGLPGEIVSQACVELGSGISGFVAQRGEPLLVRDVERDDRFRMRNGERYYTPSFISAPVVCEESVRGVINVASKRSGLAFDSDELVLLEVVGHRIGDWAAPGALGRFAAQPPVPFCTPDSD